MSWSEVGGWLKDNGGTGVALIGSLLTGNVPGAIAAGVSLVGSATGQTDPMEALRALQNDPETTIRLKELYYENEQDIRRDYRETLKLELEDAQKEHETTQETIQNGDNSDDVIVRRTRPFQSWLSLFAALGYVFTQDTPSIEILMLLLTLPWAYAGLRQIGKGISSVTNYKAYAARQEAEAK